VNFRLAVSLQSMAAFGSIIYIFDAENASGESLPVDFGEYISEMKGHLLPFFLNLALQF